MESTVISKIVSLQQHFTVSENEISQYIINHADIVVSSTITKIAKETGTSEASINRFCKKLGYKGFNKFKIALAQENFYNNMMKQTYQSGSNSIISSVHSDYQKMLSYTSAMLDEAKILEAAEHIKTANQIHIFALSNVSLIARELQFKLDQIGIHARSYTDLIDMRIQSANIAKGDLSILIASGIMLRDIVQAAQASLERGATNILITSSDSPKLNDISDYKFIVTDKIMSNNPIFLSNNLIFLFMIDVLYNTLILNDKNLQQKKMNSDAIMNNYQMMDSYNFDF